MDPPSLASSKNIFIHLFLPEIEFVGPATMIYCKLPSAKQVLSFDCNDYCSEAFSFVTSTEDLIFGKYNRVQYKITKFAVLPILLIFFSCF